MNIRPAQPEDLTAILEIVNHEIRSGVAHFGLEEQTLEFIRQEFEAARNRYPWFVAEDAGTLIGFARAYPWKARGAYNRTVEVGVYLAQTSQGKGIGTELYRQFLLAVFAAGHHALLAGTRLPNEPCVKLHEKFGFTHVGTFPEVGFKFGEWHSVGYWVLLAKE